MLEVNDTFVDILRITESVAVSTGIARIPEVASTDFYVDGRWVEQGQVDSAGYITVPSNYPVAGRVFEITVKLADGRVVNCNGIAPIRVSISNAEWIRDGTQSRHGGELPTFLIDIDDPPGSTEYYDLAFPVARSDFSNNDSLYIAGYRYGLFQPNNVMANEGDQDFDPKSLFFSDELFDGTKYHFAQLFSGGDTGGSFGTQGDYGITEPGTYLLFRSTNQAYYDYLKSWTRHRYTQNLAQSFDPDYITFERLQDLMFAPQSAPLMSNVTGGLGVVGAVHTQVVKTQ
jgi:hypothetical protein